MTLKVDFLEALQVLRDSYKNIDFRCALYKKEGGWYPILTIFRFSNEERIQLEKKYDDLNLSRYKTENFKIIYEVLDIKDWEQKFKEIYKNIDLFSEECPLDKLEARLNTPRSRLWMTENEVKEYNIINFYCSLSHPQEHHNNFSFLNKEILSIGENYIYNVLKRVFQLDHYDINVGLYFSFIFPLYIKFSNLNSTNDVISGDIEYHEIFDGSRVFFRIFSNPIIRNEFFVDSKEFQINRNNKDTKELSENYFKTSFNIDFSIYDCDPNFQIRVLSEKIIHGEYIIDLEEFLGSQRFLKSYDEFYSEDLEVNGIKEFVHLKFNSIIDPALNFELEIYNEIVRNINSAYKKKLFTCVYILARKLLENLLIDCLRSYYGMQGQEKFFNEDKKQFLTYEQLRKNFNNLIKNSDFIGRIGTIPQEIIDHLKKFQETGNVSAHSLFSLNHQFMIEENRDILNGVIRILNDIDKKLKDIFIPYGAEKRDLTKQRPGTIQKEKNKKKADTKFKRDNIKGMLLEFYKMISHEKEFNKGELISLVRDLGKYNINKYLNLEFVDSSNMITLRNELYVIIIYGPGIHKTENFLINQLRVKGNSQYTDNPENFNNKEIYIEFLNYLKEKIELGIER